MINLLSSIAIGTNRLIVATEHFLLLKQYEPRREIRLPSIDRIWNENKRPNSCWISLLSKFGKTVLQTFAVT